MNRSLSFFAETVLRNSHVMLCLLFLGMSFQTKAQVSFGEASLFNEDWLFVLDDDSLMASPEYKDASWRRLDLPHDWSVEGQLSPDLASCTAYLPAGIAWYRKHFEVENPTQRQYIYFEGVYNRSEVYLNGCLLGKRPNGYVSFMYDMTPYLKKGENILAVRVDHSRYADSRWYTGSGIYRDVYRILASDWHFAQWGVAWNTTELTNEQALISVTASLEKHAETNGQMLVAATLYDASGKEVTRQEVPVKDVSKGITKESFSLKCPNPRRWDLDTPYLYTLETKLLIDRKQVDVCRTKVGLRSLTFDADKGFALNDRWMKVKGVCIHHDAGVLGAVVPPEVWARRLKNLKRMGANAIRMSHNPQAPVVYDLCDRLGLLVMDEASDEWEFPKRKWVKGWNVGEPSYDGSYDFFEEWMERDLMDMVRRDRNHPCIFLWSIGNEVDYPNDPYSHPVLDGSTISQPMFGGYKPDAPDAMRIGVIAERLAACVRSVDTSRPVTGALAGVVMSNETAYPEAVDVVGYNYTEDRYDIDHAKYPQRIIYGSENRSDLNAWYAVKNRDFIFGQFIWTGLDYLGESGAWPSRGLYTGLLDFGGFLKPRGYFRASLWSEQPTTYIGTYPAFSRSKRLVLSTDAWDSWNYDPGQLIRVVCYTNAPQARLLLNNQEVGEMKPYDEKTGIIYWDIPYQAGDLCAQGCDAEGNILSEYSIQTAGEAFAIRARVEEQALSMGQVAHIIVEVIDEKGVVLKNAENLLTCTTEGPVRLLGLESSNNRDMSDHTDSQQAVYHGRLLAYIQLGDKQGKMRVKFTSPQLKEALVELIGVSK